MLCNGRRHCYTQDTGSDRHAIQWDSFRSHLDGQIKNARFKKKGFKNSRLRVILSPMGVLEMMVCTALRKPTIWQVHMPGALRMFCLLNLVFLPEQLLGHGSVLAEWNQTSRVS